MPSQWERFKQSNIAKIVIGYSLVVWVLIQLIEAVLPTFETPLWVAQTLTFLLILGFPIALLVGWAYEKLPAQSTDGVASVSQPAHSTPKKTLVLVGIGSCAVIGLFGFYMMPFIFDDSRFREIGLEREVKSAPLVLRYKMVIENTGVLGNGIQSHTAISPNGRYVAYSHITSSTFDIMLYDLTSFEDPKTLVSVARNLTNGFPKFSQDSQWIYYHLNDQIMRIRREGGSPQVVVKEDAAPAGIAINNNEVIYRRNSIGGLSRLDLNSGEDIPLGTSFNDSEVYDFSWPMFLPDRTKLLVTRGFRNAGETSVEIIDLRDGSVSLVAGNAFHGRYVNSGHIVFGRDDSVWAQPVNPETFISNGDAAPVIFDAEVYPSWRWANLDIASTGRLIYTAESENSGAGATRNLVFVDELGVENDFESEPAFYLLPSIDPSGERLAVTVIDPNGLRDIWVFDRSAKTFGRRSFSGDSVRSVWSFDGQQLIFSCGDKSICVTNADGTSDQSEIFSGLSQPVPLAHTGNGALLLTQGTPRNVYRTNLGDSISDLQSETILTDLNLAPADNSDAVVSNDENWIAYSSNETGRFEIYVRPFTDISSGKWQVSRQGGRYPRWDSKRNKLLWWDTEENAIMASTFNETDASNRRIISFENPSFEFDADYVLSQISRSWDFYPETGEAFFIKDMMTEDVIANQIQFHITEDFFSELDATAPAFPE